MSKISKSEWDKLINIPDIDSNELRRSNIQKFSGSVILLSIYGISSHILNLPNDFYLCLLMIGFAFLNLGLTIFSKDRKQYLSVLHFAKIASLTPIGIAAILNLDGDSIRFSFIFTFLYFVYIYDFYSWERNRFLTLYILALSQVFFFQEPIIFKVVLVLIISFITYIARDNILLKEENRKFLHLEKSFSVFQSHSNLMEHHILNSITKLLYYKLKLEELPYPKVKELSEKVLEEINYIEKVLTETKSEDLKDFNYRDNS